MSQRGMWLMRSQYVVMVNICKKIIKVCPWLFCTRTLLFSGFCFCVNIWPFLHKRRVSFKLKEILNIDINWGFDFEHSLRKTIRHFQNHNSNHFKSIYIFWDTKPFSCGYNIIESSYFHKQVSVEWMNIIGE